MARGVVSFGRGQIVELYELTGGSERYAASVAAVRRSEQDVATLERRWHGHPWSTGILHTVVPAIEQPPKSGHARMSRGPSSPFGADRPRGE